MVHLICVTHPIGLTEFHFELFTAGGGIRRAKNKISQYAGCFLYPACSFVPGLITTAQFIAFPQGYTTLGMNH